MDYEPLKWEGKSSGNSISWHTIEDGLGEPSFQIEKLGNLWRLFKDGLFVVSFKDSNSAKAHANTLRN